MIKNKKKKYLDEMFVAPAVPGTTPQSSSTIVFNPEQEIINRQAVIEAEKAKAAEEQRKTFEAINKSRGTVKADTRSESQRNRDHQAAVYNEVLQKADEVGNNFNLALGANNTAGGFKLASTAGDMILSPFAAVGGGAVAKPILKATTNTALKGLNYGLSKMGRLGKGIKNAALDVYYNPMRYVMDAAIGLPVDLLSSSIIEYNSDGKYTGFGDMINQNLGGDADDVWKPMMYEMLNPLGIGSGILADKLFSKNVLHTIGHHKYVKSAIDDINTATKFRDSNKSNMRRIEKLIDDDVTVSRNTINAYNKHENNPLYSKYKIIDEDNIEDGDNFVRGLEHYIYDGSTGKTSTMDNTYVYYTDNNGIKHKIPIDINNTAHGSLETTGFQLNPNYIHKVNTKNIPYRVKGYNIQSLSNNSKAGLKAYSDYLEKMMHDNGIDGIVVGSTKTSGHGITSTKPNDVEIMVPADQLDKAKQLFNFTQTGYTGNNTGVTGISPYAITDNPNSYGSMDINTLHTDKRGFATGIETMEIGEVINGPQSMAKHYSNLAEQQWSDPYSVHMNPLEETYIPKFDANGNYIINNNVIEGYTPNEILKILSQNPQLTLDKLALDMFSSSKNKHTERATNLLFKTDDESVNIVNKALNTIANRIDSTWGSLKQRYPNLDLSDAKANENILRTRFGITDDDFIKAAANNPKIMENVLLDWMTRELGVSRAVQNPILKSGQNISLADAMSATRNYGGGQLSGIGGNNAAGLNPINHTTHRMHGGGTAYGDFVGTTMVDLNPDRNAVKTIDDLFKGYDLMRDPKYDYYRNTDIDSELVDLSGNPIYDAYGNRINSDNLGITGILNTNRYGGFYGNVTKNKHYNTRHIPYIGNGRYSIGGVEKAGNISSFKSLNNKLSPLKQASTSDLMTKLNDIVENQNGISYRQLQDMIDKAIALDIDADELKLMDDVYAINMNKHKNNITEFMEAKNKLKAAGGIGQVYNYNHSKRLVDYNQGLRKKFIKDATKYTDLRTLAKFKNELDIRGYNNLIRNYQNTQALVLAGAGIFSLPSVFLQAASYENKRLRDTYKNTPEQYYKDQLELQRRRQLLNSRK